MTPLFNLDIKWDLESNVLHLKTPSRTSFNGTIIGLNAKPEEIFEINISVTHHLDYFQIWVQTPVCVGYLQDTNQLESTLEYSIWTLAKTEYEMTISRDNETIFVSYFAETGRCTSPG